MQARIKFAFYSIKKISLLLAVLSVVILLTSCLANSGSEVPSDSSLDTSDYSSANIGTLVYVPAGKFQRDSTLGNISIITKAYRMSRYEITSVQFTAVTGLAVPSYFTSVTNGPVEQVSWYHALVFCNKLSMAEGLSPVYTITKNNVASTDPDLWDGTENDIITVPSAIDSDWDNVVCNFFATGYRLPTEMEWMWAAMGADLDATAIWTNGVNTTGYGKVFAGSNGSNDIAGYAWQVSNSSNRTHTVGTKTANEVGLYDMSGNVWEWCWDRYDTYPTGDRIDFTGASSGTNRVRRGGSWNYGASYCVLSLRGYYNSISINDIQGFRVVRN